MNKYKIELKTNLNKEIIIAANNEKEALEGCLVLLVC